MEEEEEVEERGFITGMPLAGACGPRSSLVTVIVMNFLVKFKGIMPEPLKPFGRRSKGPAKCCLPAIIIDSYKEVLY
jgi:hypothetical protein